MPAQYKRAEYKVSRDSEPYLAKRAEWYRCSEGLTIGNRMTTEGEILHISEMDIDVPDPNNAGMLMKAETFQPLSLPEQERRFGRIMYMPYVPSEEELQALGWERTGVTADDTAVDEQLMEQHKQDFLDEIKKMPEHRLRQEAAFRYGLSFPQGMAPDKMRRILEEYYTDETGEVGRNAVSEQMKANYAQRVGGVVDDSSADIVEDALHEDQDMQESSAEEDEEHRRKVERRKAKAAKKVKEAEEQNNG